MINEGSILSKMYIILSDINTNIMCDAGRDQHGIMKKNRNLNEEDRFYFNGKLGVIS